MGYVGKFWKKGKAWGNDVIIPKSLKKEEI